MSAEGADYPISYVLQIEGDATVASKLNNVAGVLDSTAERAQTAGNQFTGFSGALAGAGTAADSAISPTQAYTGALGTMGQEIEQNKQAISESNVVNGQFSASLQQVKDSTDQVSTSTASATEKTASLKSALKESALGISTVASSATALYFQFDNLEKSELRVQTAQKNLTAAQASAASTQATLKDMQEKGITTGDRYQAAVLNAQAAQEHLAIAQEKVSLSQGDLTQAQLGFALNVVPTVISAVSTAVTVHTALKGAKVAGTAATVAESAADEGGAIAKGIHTAATIAHTVATQAATVATRLLEIAMGPVGWAILGVSTFMGLFATNAFGIRDAINAAGKAIGDAVPILRPLLDALGSIANAIFPEASKSAVENANTMQGAVSSATDSMSTNLNSISTSGLQQAYADASDSANTNFGSMSDTIGISKDSITTNLTTLQTNTTTAMTGIDTDTANAKKGVSSSLDGISSKFSATASDIESAAARMREAIASLGGNTAVSTATPQQQQQVLKSNMLTPAQVQAYSDVIKQYNDLKASLFQGDITSLSSQGNGGAASTLDALLQRKQEAERMLALDQEARRQYSDLGAQIAAQANITITVDQNGELQAKLKSLGGNPIYLNNIT